MRSLLVSSLLLAVIAAVTCHPLYQEQDRLVSGVKGGRHHQEGLLDDRHHYDQNQYGQSTIKDTHHHHHDTERLVDDYNHGGQSTIGIKGGSSHHHGGHSQIGQYQDQYQHGQVRYRRSLELESERLGVKGGSRYSSGLYGDNRLRDYPGNEYNIESGRHLNGEYGLNGRYVDPSGQVRSEIYPDQYNRYDQSSLGRYDSGRLVNGRYVDEYGRVIDQYDQSNRYQQNGYYDQQSNGRLIGQSRYGSSGVKGGRSVLV